jgi:YggT family protein
MPDAWSSSSIPYDLCGRICRVLLQLARRLPNHSQAVVALTNWLVRRSGSPAAGRAFDTASLVAPLRSSSPPPRPVRLRTGVIYPFVPLAVAALRSLALSTLMLYTVLIFVYAANSFIAPGVRSPATSLLASLCEPVLRPLRRILPVIGGIDFSPLVAIVGLTALRILIGLE